MLQENICHYYVQSQNPITINLNLASRLFIKDLAHDHHRIATIDMRASPMSRPLPTPVSSSVMLLFYDLDGCRPADN